MDIKKYIAESEKRYHLRIKTVVKLDDESVSKVENTIAKYQPIEVERAVKTILQRHPLDFKNVENAEVWIIDVVFGLPASPVDVREEIRKTLDCPETYVVVRNRNEPIEIETARLNAIAEIEEEAKERGLVAAALLSTDPDYHEYNEIDARTVAGNEYNSAFLAHLEQVRKERPDMRVKLNKEQTLFNWMKMPDRKDQEPVQDGSDFNASIKDAPRVSPKKPKIVLPNASIMGDVNDELKVVKQVYTDKKGKKVVLSRQYGKEV
jgi:hypothetical protein